MKHVEFNPINPSEYKNFVSEDERKHINTSLFIIGGILVLAVGLGVYIVNQQTKNIKKNLKRNLNTS
jgi:hypothetical protein